MSERLLAAIKRGKREGYVIAELPGVVRVIQDPESTGPRVDLCWDENNRTAGTDLADIIVRGIRSLEEERRMRLSKCGGLTPGATVEQLVDEGEEAVDALYRLMPGLGDSGEELEPVIEDWGED